MSRRSIKIPAKELTIMSNFTFRFRLTFVVDVLLLVVFTSCSPIASVKITQMAVSPKPVQSTPTAAITPLTTTITAPAKTYQLEKRCIQTIQSTPPTLNGSLVLRTTRQGGPSYTYLLNMKTGAQTPIENYGYETTSPDGDILIYRDLNLSSIVVADAKGNKLLTVTFQDIVNSFDRSSYLDGVSGHREQP
jgi:hypothetical protein